MKANRLFSVMAVTAMLVILLHAPISEASASSPCPQPPEAAADLTGDGVVNVFDLLLLLDAWGACVDPNDCPADLNGDGQVNVFDLLTLLDAWGPLPPADPTLGVALIFMDETGIGPIDFSSGQYADNNDFLAVEYRQQTEVCLHDLGEFDPETGAFITNNQGFLTGRYLFTDLDSLNDPIFGLFTLDPFVSQDNDFRVEFDWEQERQANANLSQAHAYFYITDFRRNVFNADLINRLNIDDERRKNVLYRQFKAELPPPAVEYKPLVLANEALSFGAQAIFFQQNKLQLQFLHNLGGSRQNAWSALYDPHVVTGEYAELVGHWLIDYPGIYPAESAYAGNGWKNNVLPALTDGLSVWAAYRYTGETEVFRNFFYSVRVQLGSINCGPEGSLTAPRCDQGFETRNVMTEILSRVVYRA